MPHFGTLAEHRFSDKESVDDIRGSVLYGVDDEKLGKIDDVIFDHGTGEIRYAVVDTGGWLNSKKFVVPADRIHAYEKNKDAFQIDLVKKDIEHFPPYDEKFVRSERDWADYEERFQRSWHDGVVLHKHGSDRTVTPEASEMAASPSDRSKALGYDIPPGGFGSLGEEIEPFEKADEEFEGRHIFNHGPRWQRFEDLLRKNRVDITARCLSCAPVKDRAA